MNHESQRAAFDRFHRDVGAAVTRARRAAAEAREQVSGFRASRAKPEETARPVTRPDDDDMDLSQEQLVFED